MLSKLNRYILKNLIISFAITFLVFAVLIIIGDFVEQFRKATGKNVPIKIIFQLTAFNFLGLTTFILPITAFFSSLFCFLLLIRNSELIIFGAVGIPLRKLLLPSLTLYFLIGTIFVTVLNPLIVIFDERYSELEYKYIERSDKFASITKNGLWLKQFNNESNVSSVLFAKKINNSGKILNDFMVLEYDENGAYQGRLDGAMAELTENYWKMSNIQVTPKYGQTKFENKLKYKTNIKLNDITDSLSSPTSISFWRLGNFITFLEDLGYSAREFKSHYYNLMILPIYIASLVVLAGSLIVELKQNDKVSKIIFISFLLIFFIYFLSNLFDALGTSSNLNVLASKLVMPIIVLILSAIFFQISSLRRKKYL